MNFVKLFEKVSLATPLEQRRFFSYYADSVLELIAMYGKDIFKKSGIVDYNENADLTGGEWYVVRDDGEGDMYLPPSHLEDICIVLPLYHDGIINNILFLSGADETQKSEFIRKAENAYNSYWSKRAKGRKIKRLPW